MIRSVVAAVCCSHLVGCVSMPVQENDGVSIGRVVERVKCELGRALATQPKLDSWVGNVTLTLETDQSGSVAPTIALAGPFNTGTYGLDLGFGVNGKSLQTSLVALNFEVWRLREAASRCPADPSNQFEDSLGLQQWVERSFPLKMEQGGSFLSKEKAIGYTLEFDLEVGAGITPSFSLSRVSGKQGITASRKTLNTLQVSMVDAGIVPPSTIVVAEKVEVPPRAATGDKRINKLDTENADPNSQVTTYRYRQTTRRTPGRGPDVGTEQRLDNAIRQLQLRTLRLRQ